jgi:hypothetical protein
MLFRFALMAACAGMLAVAPLSAAQATGQPIPGINIVVKKNTGRAAKPRPPAQRREAINTSRSNIKHRAASGKRQHGR